MTVPRPDLPIVLLSHRGQPRVLDQAEPAFRSARFPAFGCAWSRSTARPHEDLHTVIVNPLLWIC
jgi:hypothetical protein